MHWSTIIYCGIITYLTRFSTLFLLKEDILNDKTKKILSYVPSAIFPAIIFPPIFLDSAGSLDIDNNPKILAALFAIIIGFFSRSIIATIFAGTYFLLVFDFCILPIEKLIIKPSCFINLKLATIYLAYFICSYVNSHLQQMMPL